MKVLLTSASFAPYYGGPSRSVCGLAEHLSNSGCRVGLWAPDQSAVGTPFLSTSSRALALSGSLKQAIEQFGSIDLIHDSGLWLAHNHLIASHCRANGLPRVIATRGMLEPWARKHKWFKKFLAWHAYQKRDVFDALAIHVTAQKEADSLVALGIKCPIWVVPNGVDLPKSRSELANAPTTNGQPVVRTALFIGRIHPVKGLPMLLDAWAAVRPPNWRLQIVGPDEDGHQAKLNSQVVENGLSSCVNFSGALGDDEKWRALDEADLFVCPSYTENFGIAIAEAMASGLPVITTTGTPWQSLRDNGMGWWVEPNVQQIASALQAATNSSSEMLRKKGAKGRSYVSERFTWQGVAYKLFDHYHELLSERP